MDRLIGACHHSLFYHFFNAPYVFDLGGRILFQLLQVVEFLFHFLLFSATLSSRALLSWLRARVLRAFSFQLHEAGTSFCGCLPRARFVLSDGRAVGSPFSSLSRSSTAWNLQMLRLHVRFHQTKTPNPACQTHEPSQRPWPGRLTGVAPGEIDPHPSPPSVSPDRVPEGCRFPRLCRILRVVPVFSCLGHAGSFQWCWEARMRVASAWAWLVVASTARQGNRGTPGLDSVDKWPGSSIPSPSNTKEACLGV